MYQILNLRENGDFRGTLISSEGASDVPFEIKRLYYIFNTRTDVVRGQHAHKQLKQVLICMNGSCKLRLDNGSLQEDLLLDDRTKGIYIDTMIWREIYEFSPDCILLVLANNHYNEEDYIRNYAHFI